MSPKPLARAAILTSALAAATVAGCGQEESNVAKNRDHEVPALAPGSPSGLDTSKVDPGAAGTPATKAP